MYTEKIAVDAVLFYGKSEMTINDFPSGRRRRGDDTSAQCRMEELALSNYALPPPENVASE